MKFWKRKPRYVPLYITNLHHDDVGTSFRICDGAELKPLLDVFVSSGGAVTVGRSRS
jgi:hypothetical protein